MIMIFNRYYRRGYGMARKYVKLISFTAEISHNIKDFLDKVYSDANKPLAVQLEESLSATLLNIKEPAEEKPLKPLSQLSNSLKLIVKKINLLSKEFTPLIPWFFLVLVDYFIAISFFKQVAEGQGTIV